jgi:hypothetical protein
MEIRERFAFDLNLDIGTEAAPHSLAGPGPAGEFWLRFGRGGGIRHLAVPVVWDSGEWRPLGADSWPVDHGRQWATADRLHATVAVLAETAAVEAALRRAADARTPQPLVAPEDVPGFSRGRLGAIHKDGWYTTGERALALPPPAWAPDARAYDIREGVYLIFADGSCRLMGRREYYAFARLYPSGRQGDCWALTPEDLLAVDGQVCPDGTRPDSSAGQAVVGTGAAIWTYGRDRGRGPWSIVGQLTRLEPGAELGRHRVEGDQLVHPEHEPVEVPAGAEWLTLVPGASRPFTRTGRDGGD